MKEIYDTLDEVNDHLGELQTEGITQGFAEILDSNCLTICTL